MSKELLSNSAAKSKARVAKGLREPISNAPLRCIPRRNTQPLGLVPNCGPHAHATVKGRGSAKSLRNHCWRRRSPMSHRPASRLVRTDRDYTLIGVAGGWTNRCSGARSPRASVIDMGDSSKINRNSEPEWLKRLAEACGFDRMVRRMRMPIRKRSRSSGPSSS
jgi:hypothetical protein